MIGIECRHRIGGRLGKIKPGILGRIRFRMAFDPLHRFNRHIGPLHRRGIGIFPLKQRIAFKLGIDELAQFKVGQLKKTDRLLQLWCHHQLLALPHLHFSR